MRKATRILGLLVLVLTIMVSVAQAGPHTYVRFGSPAPTFVAPVPAPYGYALAPYGYAAAPYGYAPVPYGYAAEPYGSVWQPQYYWWTGGPYHWAPGGVRWRGRYARAVWVSPPWVYTSHGWYMSGGCWNH